MDKAKGEKLKNCSRIQYETGKLYNIIQDTIWTDSVQDLEEAYWGSL